MHTTISQCCTIFVYGSVVPFSFTGRYRRDLETKNWHYYEKDDGTIIHLRKEHIVAVISSAVKETEGNE